MPPDPRVLGTQLHRAAVRFDLSLPSTQVTEPVGLQLR